MSMTRALPPGGSAGDDAESAAVAYLQTLARLEQQGERCPIHIGPYTLITMLGVIQLALRHPLVPAPVMRIMRDLVASLSVPYAGTPGQQIIASGWDQSADYVPDNPAVSGFNAWFEAEFGSEGASPLVYMLRDELQAAYQAGISYGARHGGIQA